MRALSVVLFALAGCAEISGLDGIDVCDGPCADVTVLDAPQSGETSTTDATDVTEANALDAGNDVPAIGDTGSVPCKDPSGCKNGEVCCETLVTSGGQYPNCKVDADTVTCKSSTSCPSSTPSFMCGTLVIRRCTATADCTESSASSCCKANLADAGEREFCMSSLTAQVLNASCL